MTKEDLDRIASEYFDDKESEFEMDEVFSLAQTALNQTIDMPCVTAEEMAECKKIVEKYTPISTDTIERKEAIQKFEEWATSIGFTLKNNSFYDWLKGKA